MTIAVTGATGQLGRLVIEALKQKIAADDIVALARTPEKASDLGVPVRGFDYAAPATLAPALEGVDTLLLVSSNAVGERVAQHRHVIEAAKAAGVTRIVYTSLLHADVSPLSLAAEHLATEADLAASGVPATILRNGWYTENYTGSVGGAVAGGAFIGTSGEGRISSATRTDYADAAVAVLIGAGHEGKVYELAGDDAYTLADLAAEISRQTGQDIPYRNLSEADYAAALAGFGLPADFAAMLASWGTGTAAGALFDDGRALSALTGKSTTPMAESVKAALA
ncbi:SDR family oxidoreductase [Sphingomonas abietis]|uniref:SDR family oxidoreductase n=1 Tax=Sphingomonas abietis TaxID=3012344 RepID=A0ABY7NQ08_9SPHN|nr:SDR family oxidoreductase [Sphingomonas abietis]WBO23620.1 SDR family oxidoreductase [Sphingomonas abietis]